MNMLHFLIPVLLSMDLILNVTQPFKINYRGKIKNEISIIARGQT
ncbi:Uncharacterised protein [Mycobacteroides abscessus subsp. abscessus]|nr:Uncharacterised protein [Mycobacteroides abscessus subsp. abscessus]